MSAVKNSNYSDFILPTTLKLKLGLLSKCCFYNAKCEKVFKSCPKMYFERKQENCPAASQRKPLFHRRHLPKRSWQNRTRLKLIFLEEDCSFFSSRYYSWEVGKERCNLTFMGSNHSLARSLHRPCYPLKYTIFWKFEELFSLDSTADFSS